MIERIHHVRGRLRIRTEELKRNERKARAIVAALDAMPGVISAEANIITGSLLVHYEPQVLDAAAVMTGIKEHLATPIDLARPRASPTGEERQRAVHIAALQRKVVDAVVWYAVEKAVERAAPLVLSALL